MRLDNRLPILVIDDKTLQLGWAPETALEIHIPETHKIKDVAVMLDKWRNGIELDALSDPYYASLAKDLIRAKKSIAEKNVKKSIKIRIHGNGRIGDGLFRLLTKQDVSVTRSSQRTRKKSVSDWEDHLVILTDKPQIEPVILKQLMKNKIPHLPVRIRDSQGIIGPLVLPGYTSCLNCAHLYSFSLNQNWPLIAAQLTNFSPESSIEVSQLINGIVLNQIHTLLDKIMNPQIDQGLPELANTTIEIGFNPFSAHKRNWNYQPACGCCETIRSKTELNQQI